MTTVMVDKRMTSGETARYLGLSPQYVNKLVRAGRLAATSTRLGLLFDRSAVEAFRFEREARTSHEHETVVTMSVADR